MLRLHLPPRPSQHSVFTNMLLQGPDALNQTSVDEDQSVIRQQAMYMSQSQLQKQLEAAQREEQVERYDTR